MAGKCSLQKLALLGIAGGLLAAGGLAAQKLSQSSPYHPKKTPKIADQDQDELAANLDAKDPFAALDDSKESSGNLGYHLMTEDELKLEVNQEGWELYQSLDEEGKRLALVVASQRCNQSNACQGLNACRTEKNACAGQGECKNQGKCAFSDKNLAIKVVAKKMSEKRVGIVKPAKPNP